MHIHDNFISGGAGHGQPTRALGVSFVVYLLGSQGIQIGLGREEEVDKVRGNVRGIKREYDEMRERRSEEERK